MSVGLQRLRKDADFIRQGAIAKGEDPRPIDDATKADARRSDLLARIESLRAERNDLAHRVGAYKRGQPIPKLPDDVGTIPKLIRTLMLAQASYYESLQTRSLQIAAQLPKLEAQLRRLDKRLDGFLLRIPNPPDPDIPVGGPDASKIVRAWGTPKPNFDVERQWQRKPHWEIAEALGIIDLAAGAKVAGSGFPIYKGAGSKLQRTLIDFFLDLHTTEHGMTEIWPPAVVNEESARGTGQIPDKEDQMYVVTRDGLYLVPTAEVPVTNIHRDEIIEADRLPIRYVAYSPCFRREAGAAGAKTRGILRVHQFDKVEMVCFERPADSNETLEWLTQRAEACLQRLGLPYRVKLMATGDMGFTQAKKYDLEVWAPGVQDWLEVSSVSNFRDFQARRMNIRWRPEPGAKPEILHTLNGSGLALARTVAAILEVYQQPDGSVLVPDVLKPRLGERLKQT
jgi:seryl-tRNA synthetase